MPTHTANPFTRICCPVSVAVGAVAGLSLLGLPLPAQESPAERLKVIKRPVVVVRSSEEPVHAWSLQGSRAFLGVRTLELTSELRRHFEVPEETGWRHPDRGRRRIHHLPLRAGHGYRET